MDTSQIVDIVANGNMVLVFDTADGVKKLRVSAHNLSLASTVFKSMLAPRFKEGAALAASSSVEIALPDDDHEAMSTLCQMLHFCNDDIPSKPGLEHIFKIAMLVDKYDCAGALKPSAQCWISEHLNFSEITALHVLLMSAYYFQHPKCFQQVSSRLGLRAEATALAPSSNFKMMESCPENVMKALLALEAKRTIALKEAGVLIEKIIDECRARPCENNCLPSCANIERRFMNLVDQLAEFQLWPITSLKSGSLEIIIERMEKANVKDPGIPYCHHLQCAGRQNPTFDYARVQLRNKAKALRMAMNGMCYYCAREGKIELEGVLSCEHQL